MSKAPEFFSGTPPAASVLARRFDIVAVQKTAKVEENAKKKRFNYSKFRRAESEKKTPPHGRNQVKRVIVTPAVYPRLIEFLHFDIQSTGQKSHCVITDHRPSQCFVLIIQSDSLCPCQF
ncbi:hypothetical protein T02_1349 [Trichinella nativa]|uniref:Uncharacterized protein n=1 Tax=Trichinella nativa TaxID=6335 RepID=A0A0V1KL60_9BILA|nr:hypothetical protein T02_1349 [Trichinella nativa]